MKLQYNTLKGTGEKGRYKGGAKLMISKENNYETFLPHPSLNLRPSVWLALAYGVDMTDFASTPGYSNFADLNLMDN